VPTEIIIFIQIVFIDIIMAADNAIIIGLIAASFASADRKRIIMLGVCAAFIFRVVFALITVQLLQFPILKNNRWYAFDLDNFEITTRLRAFKYF